MAETDSGVGAVTAGAEGSEVSRPVRAKAPQTFAQKRWVQNVLPWVSSGVLHVGIVVAAVLLYQGVKAVALKVQEQIIVPDATYADSGPVGGVVNPGLGSDPNRAAAQDQVMDSQQTEVRTAQRLNQTVAGAADGTSESIIGIGGAGSFARAGGGDGADRAGGVFGVPGGGGGSGPRVNFAGVGSNAKRIVYLCDASGSMMSVFPALDRQLKKSVDGLRLPQSFGVVFFSENVRPFGAPGLVLANPDNKRRAYDFFRQQAAAGPTVPRPAIQQAFALNPEVLYVLTDGFDNADPKDVLEQFRALNREKKVKVNTIRLRSPKADGTEPAGSAELANLLRSISQESGGVYREVDKDDF